MYKGTNKTALASKKHIADAFLKLLHETPYSDISISAICKAAGVSRQTFYSIFESKENIILFELCFKNSFQPGAECKKPHLSLEDLSHEYTHYIIEKQEVLTLLVQNDIIYMMHKSLSETFLNCVCFQPNLPEEQRMYAAEFVACGLFGIAKVYITEGKKLSQDELYELIHSLLGGTALG